MEIQGRQNHCWREVQPFPSFGSCSVWCTTVVSKEGLIKACVENKLCNEKNVEKFCNGSGVLTDFLTHILKRDCASISSSQTHHTDPSELFHSFITGLMIHEHTVLKALTNPSDDSGRRLCGSRGSSLS